MTSIRAKPAGSAAARHELAMPSDGISTNASSLANSHAGSSISDTKASPPTIATTCSTAAVRGRHIPTTAVIRMCSARRSAITAPSMASQMNSMPASSSVQTSGRWKP